MLFRYAGEIAVVSLFLKLAFYFMGWSPWRRTLFPRPAVNATNVIMSAGPRLSITVILLMDHVCRRMLLSPWGNFWHVRLHMKAKWTCVGDTVVTSCERQLACWKWRDINWTAISSSYVQWSIPCVFSKSRNLIYDLREIAMSMVDLSTTISLGLQYAGQCPILVKELICGIHQGHAVPKYSDDSTTLNRERVLPSDEPWCDNSHMVMKCALHQQNNDAREMQLSALYKTVRLYTPKRPY